MSKEKDIASLRILASFGVPIDGVTQAEVDAAVATGRIVRLGAALIGY